MGRRLLIIGAHSTDFVWRAAGSIALVNSQLGDYFEIDYLSPFVDIKDMR